LSSEDIEHYQKIIMILKMTIELQWQFGEAIKQYRHWWTGFSVERGGA
jgi:hypothetical protein